MPFELNRTLSWEATKRNPTSLDYKFLETLQGNTVIGHSRRQTRHLLLQFRDAGAKTGIRAVGQLVTSAFEQLTQRDNFREAKAAGKRAPARKVFVGVLLSYQGYLALEMGAAVPTDPAFQAGMTARNPFGTGTGDFTDEWKNTVHGVIEVGGEERSVERTVDRIEKLLGEAISVVGRESGNVLRNAKGQRIEHFGYVDGRSKPLVLDEDIQKELTGAVVTYHPAATKLADLVVKCPGAAEEFAFGSYVVFAKLEQNVAAFRSAEEALANDLGLTGGDRERAGALMIGRFRDGTPLVQQNTPGLGPQKNDFDYFSDLNGDKCPVQAHIRKMNNRVSQAPIFRRGIPFGRRGAPDEPGGLLFSCYQGSIDRQFETVMKAWALDVDFQRSGDGHDPVLGTAAQPQAWPVTWGGPARTNATVCQAANSPHRFVTVRGGEYFFAPSISFLRGLA